MQPAAAGAAEPPGEDELTRLCGRLRAEFGSVADRFQELMALTNLRTIIRIRGVVRAEILCDGMMNKLYPPTEGEDVLRDLQKHAFKCALQVSGARRPRAPLPTQLLARCARARAGARGREPDMPGPHFTYANPAPFPSPLTRLPLGHRRRRSTRRRSRRAPPPRGAPCSTR